MSSGRSNGNGGNNVFSDSRGNICTASAGVIIGCRRPLIGAALVTSAGFASATEASLTASSGKADGHYQEVELVGTWIPSATGTNTATVSLPAYIRPSSTNVTLTSSLVQVNNSTTNLIPATNRSLSIVNDASTKPALRVTIHATAAIPASTTFIATARYLRNYYTAA